VYLPARWDLRAIAGLRLTVLRLGWSPENSIPGMVDTLFRKREAESKKADPAPVAIPSMPSSDAPR